MINFLMIVLYNRNNKKCLIKLKMKENKNIVLSNLKLTQNQNLNQEKS